MKTTISFLFLLLVSLPLAAQDFDAQIAQNTKEEKPTEPASAFKDAPELFGMRLGMSLEETRAAAPNLGLSSRKRRNEVGVSLSLSSKPSNEVTGVINKFLDDKLVEIDVLFNQPNKWKNVAEFINDLSQKLNMPQDAWEFDSKNSRYTLAWSHFTLEVPDINHVILSDAAARDEIQKRADERAKTP